MNKRIFKDKKLVIASHNKGKIIEIKIIPEKKKIENRKFLIINYQKLNYLMVLLSFFNYSYFRSIN